MSLTYLELQKLASQMLKEFGKKMELRKSFIVTIQLIFLKKDLTRFF